MTTLRLTIDPINSGFPLNASEAAAGLPLSGATIGVEDGQSMTVSISDGISSPLIYSATVTGNVWSVTVPSGAATMLADGTATVTADVSDQAGNPAPQASQSSAVDETAPMLAISSVNGGVTLNASL